MSAAAAAGRSLVTPDVAIVGAGPSGLTAAAALSRAGLTTVVLERESAPGGIPRHSDHSGFGIRDLKRSLRGPEYAARLVDSAAGSGVDVWTEAMVTGVGPQRSVEVTTARGLFTVQPRALVLATGARERPRTARRIPGDRAPGVFTTGQLQQLVHLRGAVPGRKAVVVGAELVSWSAVLTLREAGCEVIAMISAFAQPEAPRLVTALGRRALGVPLLPATTVVSIEGRDRVRGVVVRSADGELRRIECDTVVLTGDWIPDHELARSAGLTLDAGTLGPQVDFALRTSEPGVFAIGNLIHPVDTADVAALDGAHVVNGIRAFLDSRGPAEGGVRLVAARPLRWLAPSLLRPGAGLPARNRLLAWPEEQVARPRVTVRRDGVVVATRRVWWPCTPGRVFRIPGDLLADLERGSGELEIGVE